MMKRRSCFIPVLSISGSVALLLLLLNLLGKSLAVVHADS